MLCNVLGISNHSSSEEDWVRSSINGNSISWKKNTIGQGIVPDVEGMTFRDALYLLEQAGLKVIYEGKGRVKSQSITAGGKVSKGDRIYIQLG